MLASGYYDAKCYIYLNLSRLGWIENEFWKLCMGKSSIMAESLNSNDSYPTYPQTLHVLGDLSAMELVSTSVQAPVH